MSPDLPGEGPSRAPCRGAIPWLGLGTPRQAGGGSLWSSWESWGMGPAEDLWCPRAQPPAGGLVLAGSNTHPLTDSSLGLHLGETRRTFGPPESVGAWPCWLWSPAQYGGHSTPGVHAERVAGGAPRPCPLFCGMIAPHSSCIFTHTTLQLPWFCESAVILTDLSWVGDEANLESDSLGLN